MKGRVLSSETGELIWGVADTEYQILAKICVLVSPWRFSDFAHLFLLGIRQDLD